MNSIRFFKAIILLLGIFVLLINGCTHIDRPEQIVTHPEKIKNWGTDPPKAKDRARHPISGEKPFEWWYFDGHLDNGQVFVGVYQVPSFVSGEIEAIFSLYSKDWSREDHIVRLNPDEVKVSYEDLHIETPVGFIRRLDDAHYHVKWNIDDIEAEFTLTTLSPGWMPTNKTGKVNQPERDFFWAVHQGRNRIEGTITKNGKIEHVTGIGYADHNWGEKPLHKITRKWVWGRIIAGDYTIIYADVDYFEPGLVLNPLYIAKGDKMIVGSNPAIRQWNFETHPLLKRHYPKQIAVTYGSKDIQLSVNIKKKRLVEDVDLLEIAGYNGFLRWMIKTFIARPTYFRVIADFDGKVMINDRVDNISGECLYEVMGFE